MKLQKLLSYVRQAVNDYDMIAEGDRIAIGVSGGKDSICLLVALAEMRRFYPQKFDIEDTMWLHADPLWIYERALYFDIRFGRKFCSYKNKKISFDILTY